MKQEIEALLPHITQDVLEKKTIIALSLLGAITGQNTFLLGPPGTAKSLIARRISKAFKEQCYFESLMNRFTAPEDIFGPVSLTELKKDNYLRLIDGYLPSANFAFLDEIWKSSPAILNSLLTILNEGIFKNGKDTINVPLQSLISASNEIPKSEQGLNALYDRFILRLMVAPIALKENFESLISSKPAKHELAIPEELLITFDELTNWRKAIHAIEISPECLQIIHLIRSEISDKYDELEVYVSDRRWQRAAYLMKASAFCNNRKKTNHSDAILLKHCLWDKDESRKQVAKIVETSVQKIGIHTNISISELDKEKAILDNEIHKELYHTNDIYEEIRINNTACYEAKGTFVTSDSYYRRYNKDFEIYIPVQNNKTNKDFHPIDANGNQIKNVTCNFNQQGSCSIKRHEDSDCDCDCDYEQATYTPNIIFHKGDKKKGASLRLIQALKSSVMDTKNKMTTTLNEIQNKFASYQAELTSAFIDEKDINIILAGITTQLSNVKLTIKDCERLEALCR